MAPLPLMLAGVVGLALLVLVSVWLVTHQPWLGLTLEPAGDAGVRVEAVDARGPLAGRLAPGDHLTAVQPVGGEPLSLAGFDPARYPFLEPDFAGFDALLARQGALAAALWSGQTILITADGRRIVATPASPRPTDTLSLGFWSVHLSGFLGALIGIGVWAFRRGQPAARLLALSALGFFGATWTTAFYMERELALPEAIFRLLSYANHWALAVMMGGLLALLLYYPRRLTRAPVAVWVVALCLFYQLNEIRQWIEWPLHTFFVPITVFYLLIVAAAAWQWRLSRDEPLDRAALRWVLLSVFVSMSLAFITYLVPLMVRDEPLLPQVAVVGIGALLYLGFAGGVLRYRLFDLERWWFAAWGWLLGGLLVLLVDLALIALFGLQPLQALGAAVILVGWVYFPVRQWVWRHLAVSGRVHLESHLSELAGSLFAASGPKQTEAEWRRTLQALFEPLSIDQVDGSPVEPSLEEHGAHLLVPCLETERVWRLRYGRSGRRLFTRWDREQAAALLAVARRVTAVAKAKESGARTERQRIARDLHDDVAGRLLNLVHRAADHHAEQRAREALDALRGAINALRNPQPSGLAESLADWRDTIRDWTDAAGVDLDWYTELGSDALLTPRQAINLRRILTEAVTNALRHANPTRISVAWRLRAGSGELELAIHNDVRTGTVPSDPPMEGRGSHNMLTRTRELGGRLVQGPAGDGGYRVQGRIPLGTATAVDAASE